MVGIMSLMPTLLGIQMDEILDQLPVAPRVKQALSEPSGQHGPLLLLVAATEQTDQTVLDEARQRLPGISADFLGTCLALSLSWANNLGQERAAD